VLRLTLKRKWFDMIASGEKREEYREVGPWINSRIHGKKYDVVEFKNGYGTSVPTVIVEYKGAMHGTGKPEWGAIPGKHYLVLCLGKVISSKNMLPRPNLIRHNVRPLAPADNQTPTTQENV
jgi:signal peptidase I